MESGTFRVIRSALIAAALALLLPAPQLQAQDFGRRERSVDVLHYDIRIIPNLAASSLRGDVRITTASLRDTLASLRLDAVAMRIDSVFVDGMPVAFRYDSSSLNIGFARPLRYGDTAVARIVYACTPRRGMYFIKPDASFPDDPVQIWTQGQGEDNRHWLPCYDFPNDKATSELRAVIDTSLLTLSNGRLLSRTDNGDGTAEWHWLQDKRHSSYLIMFAAGKYGVFADSSRGVAVESYHYLQDDAADVARTYGSTADMLGFFTDFIGLPYPWDKYAQIPVAHFLYGGMENTSATVLADTRTVVDARSALDYDPEPLIAHELAHQWWGDYVTYIDWNNEWLNEGFATYYQQRWTLERYGKDDFDQQRYEGIKSYCDWADKEGRLPVVYRRGTGRANTYTKGAAVLHMLNDMLGEEQYRRVMKEYLTRHALGSVETNDLKRSIEDVTGLNLHWFFSQWLYKAGYPELKVTTSWDEGQGRLSVEVKQVQAIDSLCGRFRFTLNVLSMDSDGRETKLRGEVLGPDTVLHFSLQRVPARVEIDPDNILCGRIDIEQSDEQLIAELRESRSIAIRLRAVGKLAGRITSRPELFSVLADCARSDRHRAVRKAAAAVCTNIDSTAGVDRGALRALFLDLRSDANSGVRALAFNGLRKFHDPSLRDVFLEGMRDSSCYVEAGAMNCLLDADGRDAWSILEPRLTSSSRDDVLAMAALDWVPDHRSPEALGVVLKLAGPGHSLALRAKAFETLLRLKPGVEQVRELLLKQLLEPRWQLRLYAVSALTVLGREEAERMAYQQLARESDPRVREHIMKVIGSGVR